MNGHCFLNISNNIDCCILLLVHQVFHDGSAKFTTGDFECMVCLKKFTLQKPFKITSPSPVV